jgi:hypothetical protein
MVRKPSRWCKTTKADLTVRWYRLSSSGNTADQALIVPALCTRWRDDSMNLTKGRLETPVGNSFGLRIGVNTRWCGGCGNTVAVQPCVWSLKAQPGNRPMVTKVARNTKHSQRMMDEGHGTDVISLRHPILVRQNGHPPNHEGETNLTEVLNKDSSLRKRC